MSFYSILSAAVLHQCTYGDIDLCGDLRETDVMKMIVVGLDLK